MQKKNPRGLLVCDSFEIKDVSGDIISKTLDMAVKFFNYQRNAYRKGKIS
jgi:hypothetical protein